MCTITLSVYLTWFTQDNYVSFSIEIKTHLTICIVIGIVITFNSMYFHCRSNKKYTSTNDYWNYRNHNLNAHLILDDMEAGDKEKMFVYSAQKIVSCSVISSQSTKNLSGIIMAINSFSQDFSISPILKKNFKKGKEKRRPEIIF